MNGHIYWLPFLPNSIEWTNFYLFLRCSIFARGVDNLEFLGNMLLKILLSIIFVLRVTPISSKSRLQNRKNHLRSWYDYSHRNESPKYCKIRILTNETHRARRHFLNIQTHDEYALKPNTPKPICVRVTEHLDTLEIDVWNSKQRPTLHHFHGKKNNTAKLT
jgi:hypothetical protein